MREKISTPIRKENFAGSGVTQSHFVTPAEPCDHPDLTLAAAQPTAGVMIRRRYSFPPAVLDALIEALYFLLTDASDLPGAKGVALASAKPSDLHSEGARVRNAS
jgi:hypothetical protein